MENCQQVVSVPEHSKQSINSHDFVLSEQIDRLSLSTPPSTTSPSASPTALRRTKPKISQDASPGYVGKIALRRSPSSGSLGGNDPSSTSTLHKRASLSSLQGAGGVTPPRSPAMRRTSSFLNSSPNPSMGARPSLPHPIEESSKTPIDAVSVARDFFERDLEANHGSYESATDAQTVVILQDDCYGHRYSRPRTSRAGLNTIVERPERIHASVLGMACAYVRLGGRHAEGVAAPHPKSDPACMPPAPFKIHKTTRRLSLRSPAATTIHGTDWMNELSAMCDSAESKLALNGKELTRSTRVDQAHESVQAEKAKLHEGDLYLCSGSLDALQGALGGVCDAVDIVFSEKQTKRAFICIRPPGHHCSANMPSGFCWLNNVHVGIGHASISHGLTHAAIIDFDLHHGDGSQAITWAHNARVASLPKNTSMSKKTAIGYFSLHDINSYPCEMGDEEKVRNASLCIENAHGQSIWNVHLQPWKTEAEFWTLYEDKYLIVLAKARSFLRAHSDKLRQGPTHPKPRAAIFLSAGFDASEWESPGMQRHQVNVPTSFYARFTRDIVSMAEEGALGVDGRIISVLEGGYSNRALMSGVLSHVSGLSAPPSPQKPSGISESAHEMRRRVETPNTTGQSAQEPMVTQSDSAECFDPRWWSLANIEEIETLANPSPTPTASKKQRNDSRPTYTSATQSYTAKIVSPSSARRSFSGSGPNPEQGSFFRSRDPSPPPPVVHWATAAYELSKILVPTDRETKSCKPEELNAEATRARRDRQSTIGLPVDGPPTDRQGMQLREKRTKVPTHVAQVEEDRKAVSKTHRRKTIADVNALAQQTETDPILSKAHAEGQSKRPARRRSSIASSTASHATELSTGSLLDSKEKRNPLVVKKTRASANAGPERTKPKAIRKKPAVPELPKVSDRSAPMIPTHEHGKTPLSVNNERANQDVDQLSSGMKKIKLNVPPKDEHEARLAKPKPPTRGRSAKSVATKAGTAASPDMSKSDASAIVTLPKSVPDEHAELSQSSPSAILQDVHDTILTQASLETKSSNQAPQSSDSKTNLTSLSSISEGPSSMHMAQTPFETREMHLSFSSPARQMPCTPTRPKRTKQDLPIFTSTSPLSFGTLAAMPSSVDQAVKTKGDTATLAKEHFQASSAQNPFKAPDSPRQLSSMEGEQTENTQSASDGTTKVGETTSIWDIPDTPQIRNP